MRRVQGTVRRVRCDGCAASFPTFVFSGDTDMATYGLVAMTAIHSGALALAALNPEEYSAGFAGGQRLAAERVSHQLSQSMVAVDVVRYEHRSTGAAGDSFQQFRQGYRAPEPIYSCPACGGDARVEEELTPEAFLASGGKLILTHDLTLATP